MNRVINDAPCSASGPDAIPFEAYQKASGLAVELFFDLTNALLDGNDILGKDFNLAYMICTPKKPDGQLDDLTPYYSAGGTRPLSIVDAGNRILASILR